MWMIYKKMNKLTANECMLFTYKNLTLIMNMHLHKPSLLYVVFFWF